MCVRHLQTSGSPASTLSLRSGTLGPGWIIREPQSPAHCATASSFWSSEVSHCGYIVFAVRSSEQQNFPMACDGDGNHLKCLLRSGQPFTAEANERLRTGEHGAVRSHSVQMLWCSGCLQPGNSLIAVFPL